MDEITANNNPRIVSVKDFRIDADYAAWLSEIKRRYISAQIKASIKINTEKLRFNWSVGRDLVMRKAEERWGSGVVEQLSLDLKEAFPQEKGFSSRNMWRMKNCHASWQNCNTMRIIQLKHSTNLVENQICHLCLVLCPGVIRLIL